LIRLHLSDPVLIPLVLALASMAWGIVERAFGKEPGDQVILASAFGFWAVVQTLA
jgi:hypothetical protein